MIMKRTHLWPYVVLMLMGFITIFAFEQFLVMVVGFLFCTIGTAQLIFHLTVDEHFRV